MRYAQSKTETEHLHFTPTIDPLSILRPPHNPAFIPNKQMRSKIARYFKEVLATRVSSNDIGCALPKYMPSWAKVRIGNSGDVIRGASASVNKDDEREMCFVRVSEFILYDNLLLSLTSV